MCPSGAHSILIASNIATAHCQAHRLTLLARVRQTQQGNGFCQEVRIPCARRGACAATQPKSHDFRYVGERRSADARGRKKTTVGSTRIRWLLRQFLTRPLSRSPRPRVLRIVFSRLQDAMGGFPKLSVERATSPRIFELRSRARGRLPIHAPNHPWHHLPYVLEPEMHSPGKEVSGRPSLAGLLGSFHYYYVGATQNVGKVGLFCDFCNFAKPIGPRLLQPAVSPQVSPWFRPPASSRRFDIGELRTA